MATRPIRAHASQSARSSHRSPIARVGSSAVQPVAARRLVHVSADDPAPDRRYSRTLRNLALTSIRRTGNSISVTRSITPAQSGPCLMRGSQLFSPDTTLQTPRGDTAEFSIAGGLWNDGDSAAICTTLMQREEQRNRTRGLHGDGLSQTHSGHVRGYELYGSARSTPPCSMRQSSSVFDVSSIVAYHDQSYDSMLISESDSCPVSRARSRFSAGIQSHPFNPATVVPLVECGYCLWQNTRIKTSVRKRLDGTVDFCVHEHLPVTSSLVRQEPNCTARRKSFEMTRY